MTLLAGAAIGMVAYIVEETEDKAATMKEVTIVAAGSTRIKTSDNSMFDENGIELGSMYSLNRDRFLVLSKEDATSYITIRRNIRKRNLGPRRPIPRPRPKTGHHL